MSGPIRITYELPRGVDHTVAVQRYFLMGFARFAEVRITGETVVTRPFREIDRKLTALYRTSVLRNRTRLPFLMPRRDSGIVGRYVAEIDGATVRFVIDGRDQGEIFDEDAGSLAWADLYFKTNRWPSKTYDPKVVPLLNPNGFIDWRRIDQLRSLREHRKDLDVAYITNVWGGREHCVRLFEELAKLEANTHLHAIFPWGFDATETEGFKKRLRSLGVRCTDEQIPLDELWSTLARAKVVFFRAGKHLCLPWRTLDVLGMGACLAFDSVPYPEWYVPLRPGVNFVDCGIVRPVDTSPAPDEEYANVAPTVRSLLDSGERMSSIRAANSRYFDEHAAPEPVAAHIIEQLRTHVG